MRSIALLAVVFVAFASGFPYDDDDESVKSKAAPWWAALRDEAFYRQCQSSCTEFSRGTMTRVELCDDTEVCIL